MIKHIVMWKLKDYAKGAQKEENALKIKSDLEALKQKIEQIGEIEVGINIVDSEAAYDVVLYSVFANENKLEEYRVHPEHVKVADYIGKVVDKRVVVDYQK